MTSYDVTSGLADEVVLSYDANFNSAVAPTPSGDSTKSPTSKEGASTLSTGGGDNSSYGSRTLDSKDVDGMIDSRSESGTPSAMPDIKTLRLQYGPVTSSRPKKSESWDGLIGLVNEKI